MIFSEVYTFAVASWTAVLSDSSLIDKIKEEQHRKLLGFDMEAYALFCTAENAPRPKPLAFYIKSVVDFGEADKDEDFQDFGCYASAQVAKTIIECLLDD